MSACDRSGLAKARMLGRLHGHIRGGDQIMLCFCYTQVSSRGQGLCHWQVLGPSVSSTIPGLKSHLISCSCLLDSA